MGHHNHAESYSVLSTVQSLLRQQVRSKHFSVKKSALQRSQPSSELHLIANIGDCFLPSTPTRTNTTYAAARDVDLPSKHLPPSLHVPSFNESGTPQTTQHPPHQPEVFDLACQNLPRNSGISSVKCSSRQSPAAVADVVRHILQTTEKPTLPEFNIAPAEQERHLCC
ncbi:hypothetical protein M378DRAFT_165864 [Amanita muscaria Koide BX008]|uniref:Uncharacterized protein n=1 Tax=Amanita muscaria (strain Koide BX008) TaxID=946122 RepID=A0A0C2WL84_AMAMK|nr:hypothetical protein M378DRAFT_165864 [Amanita muscaria Koide BX008]